MPAPDSCPRCAAPRFPDHLRCPVCVDPGPDCEGVRCDVELSADFRRRYLLLAPLGAGGMGYVYIAADREMRRPVAIKFLQQVDSSDHRQRFAREARLMARISHPLVVTLYDHGEEGRHPYLVCRYVPGPTLYALIGGGRRMPLARVLALGGDVAEGLLACHDAGIWHRDLKPANVLIDQSGRALVADFGISRRTDPDATRLTQAGAFLGTPGYMAPEVFLGGEIAAAADVYSLGTVLYEMLAGMRPIECNNYRELFDRKKAGDFRPLSATGAQAPAWVAELVHAMLAPDPAHRPALRAIVERLRAQLPPTVLPAPPPTAAPAAVSVARTAARSGAPLALAAVLATVLLVLVDVGLYFAKPESPVTPPGARSSSRRAVPAEVLARIDALAAILDGPVELFPLGSGHARAAGEAPLVVVDPAGIQALVLESGAGARVALASGRVLDASAPVARVSGMELVPGLNWVRVERRGDAPVEVRAQRSGRPPRVRPGAVLPQEYAPYEALASECPLTRPFDATDVARLARRARELCGDEPETLRVMLAFVEYQRHRASRSWDALTTLELTAPLSERTGFRAWPDDFVATARRLLDALSASLVRRSGRWDSWHQLGVTLTTLGHVDAGRVALTRALQRRPLAWQTWRAIADVEADQASYTGPGALAPAERAGLRAHALEHYAVAESLAEPGSRATALEQMRADVARLQRGPSR